MLTGFDDDEDNDDHYDCRYHQDREQPNPDSLVPWAPFLRVARVGLLSRKRAE